MTPELWQIALIYVAGGTLTVWLAFLWCPTEEGKEEEDVPAGILFVLWPIFWLVYAGWLVFNFPNGIKWFAGRCRARLEEENNQ